MGFLEEMFRREVIEKLGGETEVHLFGRDIEFDELLPIGSEIREDIFNRWLIKKGEDNHDRVTELVKISENRHRLNGLSDSFNEYDVIPFLGAGTSVPSNMLTWEALLRDLMVRVKGPRILNRINIMLANSDYEGAADEIYKRLGKSLFNELIENKYKALGPNDINGPIKIIPEIFNGVIITTNFDNVIETILKNFDEPYEVFQGQEIKTIEEIDDGGHIIIKLHGDIREPSNRILLKSEYELAYRNRKFRNFVKKAAADRCLLFIGCSLVKDRYLDTIKPRNGYSHTKRHYAIMKLPMKFGDRDSHRWIDTQEKALSRFNIFPIWIEEYTDIEVILFTLLKIRTEELYSGN